MLRTLGAVATVLLVSGCVSRVAGPDAPPYRPDGPTRDQVLLAEGLCVATLQLDSSVSQGKDVLATPPDPSESAFMSDSGSYLRGVSTYAVESLATSLEELPESGIEVADSYAASLADEITRVAPDIDKIIGEWYDLDSKTEGQRRDLVGQVVGKLESVDPDGPDLRTLVRQNREFAAVYDLAPHCEPLTPPPPSSTAPTSTQRNVPASEAADGTDLSACTDGTCEVAITGTATVTVGSFTVAVTVAGGDVSTVEEFAGGGRGETTLGGVGGESIITVGDETLTMTLVGLHGDTAVMKFVLS